MKFFLGKRKCFRDESASNSARAGHSVAVILQTSDGCASVASAESVAAPGRPSVELCADEGRVCGSSAGYCSVASPPPSNRAETVPQGQNSARALRNRFSKENNGSGNYKSECQPRDLPGKENSANMRMKNGTRDSPTTKEVSSRAPPTSQQSLSGSKSWAESGLASVRMKKGGGPADATADSSPGQQHSPSPFSSTSSPLGGTTSVPSPQLVATTTSCLATSPISVSPSAPSPLLLAPRAISMCGDKTESGVPIHHLPTRKGHPSSNTSKGNNGICTDAGGPIKSRDASLASLTGTNTDGTSNNSVLRSSIVSSAASTRHAVVLPTVSRGAESPRSTASDEPAESPPGSERNSTKSAILICKASVDGSFHSSSLEDNKSDTGDQHESPVLHRSQQNESKSSSSLRTAGCLEDDDATTVAVRNTHDLETAYQPIGSTRRNARSNVNSSSPTATTSVANSTLSKVSSNINSVNESSSLSFDIEADATSFAPRRSLLTSTVGSCGAAPTGFADGPTGTVITADVEFVSRRPSTATERSNIRRTSATWTAVEDGAQNPADVVRNPFLDIPRLNLELNAADQASIVLAKLDACCTIYDFTRNTHLEEKEAKRATLLELVKFINSTTTGFPVVLVAAIVRMVTANIFRALPPPFHATSNISASGTSISDLDEEDAILEASWPHLQVVYEFFLRFLISNDVDPKTAKRFIDQQFVVKFLELFSSEDPRERDYVKTILHRIYGKIMTLRSFIRKAIQHIFLQYIHYNDSSKGVAEMLEILGSIINGFALPLKEEHKRFLERSLIPLHKAKTYTCFNQQLTYCMIQYVEKDYRLAEQIIHGVLRYWPVTNTNKEVIFLNELEEILELTQPGEFRKIMNALFHRMAMCIQSPHYQVSERVLFLWNNQSIVSLFNLNKQHLFPVIIGALYRNSKQHWNSTVHGLTYKVSKLLASADPKLFDECSARNALLEESRPEAEARSNRMWELLEEKFKQARNNEVK